MAKAKQASELKRFVKRRDGPAEAAPVTKGRGKTIGVTLRLDPDDWEKLRLYAIQNRTSIQKIALQGCALIVDDAGLKLKGAA